jgi:hypothetical protein
MSTDLDRRLPDVHELERQAEEFEMKAAAIRQILAGIQTLNGDARTVFTRRSFEAHRTSFEIAPRDPRGPRGPKAVLRVMAENPHREWKVVEIKREMLRRGWAPTPKAVEASVKRLRADERIVPGSTYGYYRLAPSNFEQASALTDVQGEDGDAQ